MSTGEAVDKRKTLYMDSSRLSVPPKQVFSTPLLCSIELITEFIAELKKLKASHDYQLSMLSGMIYLCVFVFHYFKVGALSFDKLYDA